MNPEISSKPSSPFFSFILLFFVLVDLSRSLSVDWYSNCKSEFTCGYISGLGYPFWGDNRGNHCGYPELELKCENNIPRIVLGGVTYRALEFTEDFQVLRIAREDYFDGICPQNFANITLDSKLCELSDFGFTNCTLVYGCPNPPGNGNGYTSSLPSANFTCSISKAESETGYIIPPGVNIPTSCFASEIVPVSRIALSGLGTDFTTVDSLLQTGFEVKLKVDTQTCLNCAQSNGVCGYDPLVNKTVCYCANQTSVSTTCPSTQSAPAPKQEGTATASPGKKNSSSLGIGLGIGGAGILVLFLGLFTFAFVKRRRTAAQANTRDLPSTPSSKQLLISPRSQSKGTPSYGSLISDIEMGGNTYMGVKIFTYHELEEATNNFDPSKELGDGGFGTVYHGVLRNGSVVAVKRLYQNNLKRVDQFVNEIEILTRLQHPNLVKLYGYTSTQSRELLLVYEFISNGTVADHLFGKQASSNLLPWPFRLKIATETAEALAYLHRSDIIHRDVKSNNILLDHNFCVKVADFGLSRLFPSDVTHVSTAPQGTPGYVDPEYYQCYKLTDKSDVYSFGVVLCELVSTKPAVDTSRHRHDINLANMAINRIQNHTLHEFVDPALGFETDYAIRKMMTAMAELAFRCLQEEKEMRPTMEEVLEVLKGIGNEEISEEKVEAMEEVMDALRGFGEEKVRSKKPEVMDFRSEDVGMLRNVPPPLSPDSVASV